MTRHKTASNERDVKNQVLTRKGSGGAGKTNSNFTAIIQEKGLT
jgi:hypothetical protein